MTNHRFAASQSIFWFVLFFLWTQDAFSQSDRRPNALVVLNSRDVQSLHQVISEILVQGGHIAHIFPPSALIGYVPQQTANNLRSYSNVAYIGQTLADTSALSPYGESARVAAYVWNTTFQRLPASAPQSVPKGIPRDPPGDALIAPDTLSRNAPPTFQDMEHAAAPSFFQTSEYFIGSVAVGIITPESNGGIDPNTETWSSVRQDTVVAKIVEGLQWWKDNVNAPSNISFIYDIRHSVPTSYEPIGRSVLTKGSGLAR